MVNFISDMIEVKDKDRLRSIIQLDLPHDFDSISHEMLLSKMSYYGFSQAAVGWLKSSKEHLADKLQATRLGGDVSGPLSKARGVPQGSGLGPILLY